MRKIKYPLIVSDYDGTLLRSNATVSEETKVKIHEYINAGGKFVVCSGRLLKSVYNEVNKLELTGLVGAFQGAVIGELPSEKVLVEGYIPTREAVRICQKCEELQLHTHVYELDVFYTNVVDEQLADYEKLCGVKGVPVLNEPLSALIERKRMHVQKILVLVKQEDKKRVYEVLNEAFGEEFYVTYSAAFLVEITNKKYSKGTALQYIANYYNVPIEKTIAVGDNFNDTPMIFRAGLGIAVANADKRLKQVADVIFESTNDENAIGKIIEKYGFTE